MDYKSFFGARKETIDRLKELYNDSYLGDRGKDMERKFMMMQEWERLCNFIDLTHAGNVLDIGCGWGDFISKFPKSWDKYGIELIDSARKVAETRGIITDFKLKDDFFDIIIFRGTIQHIPDPIYRIGECYYWLKNNGLLVFLATPNTNSPYYKCFNTLPCLDSSRNFLLPSDLMLYQILKNFGFKVEKFIYPYVGTPYAHPIRDGFNFLLKFIGLRKNVRFPFPKSMMECYAKKVN